MSGWERREVAIPIASPAPIVWAGTDRDRRKRGAAEHWADWQPDNDLLLLRSSVPVRSNDADPGATAFAKALAYWHSGKFALGLASIDEKTRLLAWTWSPRPEDAA